MKTFKFNNPNAPASVKQRLLLRRLTGIDNRKQKFTMQSISREIDKARANKAKKTVKAQIVTFKINGETVKAQII